MVNGASTIADGINRKDLHDSIEKKMRELIEASAAAGAPNVIVLAGNRRGMGDEEGIENAVAYFQRDSPGDIPPESLLFGRQGVRSRRQGDKDIKPVFIADAGV